MMRSKNILGVNMLKIADNRPIIIRDCLFAVVDLYLKGEIIPQVGAVYPVSKIAEAHALLEGGKSTGKITVVWE
jgi:NADPH2:quinone reductase